MQYTPTQNFNPNPPRPHEARVPPPRQSEADAFKPRQSESASAVAGPRRAGAPHAPAFTLTEVMVAMAVFVIGFTAVAAIFPVGMRLQRQTQSEMLAKQAAHSAEATLRASRLYKEELADAYFKPATREGKSNGRDRVNDKAVDDSGVTALRAIARLQNQRPYVPGGPLVPTGQLKWPLADRTFPSAVGLRAGQNSDGVIVNADIADYYWVPLVRDDDPSASQDWQVYVFILKRADDAEYPTRPSPPDYVWGNKTAPFIQTNEDEPPRPNGSYDAGQFPDGNPVPGIRGVQFSSTTPADNTIEFTGGSLDLSTTTSETEDAESQFNVGDKLIGDDGSIFQVIQVNTNTIRVNGSVDGLNNAIWYAPPPVAGGEASPGLRIVTVPTRGLFDESN